MIFKRQIYSFVLTWVLCIKVTELETAVSEVEVERDFYFGKLRDIEVLCQDNEGSPLVTGILDIMYSTQVSVIMKIVDIPVQK